MIFAEKAPRPAADDDDGLEVHVRLHVDPTAVADVDAAFYQTVERYRESNGDTDAEHFRLLCEYANAGAVLGAEFANAKKGNNLQFAESVQKKALDMGDSLPSDCYGDIFRRAYTHYSVNA